MRVQTLWLPKSGHAADEYEDAFGASDPETFPFRAVVADGATESAFSGEWARTLVAAYLEQGDVVQAAASARTLFTPALDGRWYVQAKAAQGAHAALLGLEIDAGGSERDARWRAASVGDCCLFILRGGRLYRSWPYTDAAAFNHRPTLVSSQDVTADVNASAGTSQQGDAFILATDALAAWLLDNDVEALLACDDFEGFVAKARRAARHPLRNDDTTAVIVRI